MRLRLSVCSIALFLLANAAWAAELPGECSVRFFGDSTLHHFSGTAPCEAFHWPLQGDAESATVEIGDAVVRVPVAGMTTADEKRDKKMYEMFSAADFPVIEGHFGRFDPNRLLTALRAEDGAAATLPFELVIRDLSRPVAATLKDLREDPEQISLAVAFAVSLSDFQLKPPSVLGLIRVADEIRIEVDLVLKNDNLLTVSPATVN